VVIQNPPPHLGGYRPPGADPAIHGDAPSVAKAIPNLLISMIVSDIFNSDLRAQAITPEN
jgi:hypothetical protein